MNILPKKRWHVRTKDNVARVRRDQAQAREEEKARLERASLAEQESRTNFLRQKAAVQRERDGLTSSSTSIAFETPSTSSSVEEKNGHVNFFADLEEQERTFGVNKDYEKEKRLEKEAEEKKIGLLKYLGEGSTELTKETPWYQKIPQRNVDVPKSTIVSKPPAPIDIRSTVVPPAKTSLDSTTRKRKRKKKKSHRRRRSSSKSSSTDSNDEETSGGDNRGHSSNIDIEKLRQERMKREREERLRTEAALRRMRGEKEPTKANVPHEQYEQKYSSQFNPNLARQNRLD